MGGRELQSCSSKRFAQKGVWEQGLRDKNIYCGQTQTTPLGHTLQNSVEPWERAQFCPALLGARPQQRIAEQRGL